MLLAYEWELVCIREWIQYRLNRLMLLSDNDAHPNLFLFALQIFIDTSYVYVNTRVHWRYGLVVSSQYSILVITGTVHVNNKKPF